VNVVEGRLGGVKLVSFGKGEKETISPDHDWF
jgi:hypothetical protein